MGWAATLAARVLRRPRWPAPLPTADFYLLAGVADRLAADGAPPTSQRPLVRIGPNVWTNGDRAVVVRYVTDDELDALAAHRWQSLDYVVDDLIPGAAESPELPEDYRARLAAFATTRLPRLLALDPVIVAPSEAIRAAFPGHRSAHLDPCCLALADGALPPSTPWPDREDAPLDIAFLGTRSHAGSLALIDAIAERLARALPHARLTLFFGRHLPPAIAGRANVVNRPALAWPAYRAYARTARFNAALAPVQATPFATARSITKVMDHAAVGAVGLYSARPPFDRIITQRVDGLLIGSDAAGDWVDALVMLARDPRAAGRIAAAGQDLARTRGDPERLRSFWTARLGLEQSGPAQEPALRREP